MLPSQVEVHEKMNIIINEIQDLHQFLLHNYGVLYKLPYHRRSTTTNIIISNCYTNTLQYTAPEVIKNYVKIVAFYLALEQLHVDPALW